MKKDIIINATSSEIRVALTEDNRLAELFLELPDKERHVGSIFMGRVERVVQGMNAAFVDIGLEQHAFLHFSDAANAGEDFSDLLTDDDDDEEQLSEKEQKGGKDERKGRDNSRGKGQKPQKNQNRRSGGNQQDSDKQSGQNEEQDSGKQDNRQRDNRRGGKKRPSGQPKDDRDQNAQKNERQGKEKSDARKQDGPDSAKQGDKNEDPQQKAGENQEQPKRRRPRPAPRGRHPRRKPPTDEKRQDSAPGDQSNAPRDSEPAGQEKDGKSRDSEKNSTGERSQKRPNRRRGGRSGSQKKEGQETSGNEKDGQKSNETGKSGQQPRDGKESSTTEKPEESRNEDSPRSGRGRSSRRKKSPQNRSEAQSEQQKSGDAKPSSDDNRGRKDAEVKREEKTGKPEASATGKDTEKPKRRRPPRKKKAPQEESTAPAKDASNQDNSGKKAEPAAAQKKDETPAARKSSEEKKESGSTTKRRKRPARKKPAKSDESPTSSENTEKPKSSGPKTMDAKLPTFQTKRHGEVTIALEKGQEILVQVTRESYASKGVKVSTKISLPGRFIVLLPLDPVVGISRKVMEVKERRRLRAIARKMLPEGFGCIIRTVAQDKDSEVLEQELQMLLDRWKAIEDELKTASTPALLYQDQSVANTVMRDLFTPDVSRVLIDNKNLYTEIRDYVSWAAPALMNKVEHYSGRSPIFQHTGVEKELDKMLGAKVWLSTGGYIILEQTEAMMVIDVNSGRYAKDKEQEINALRTNLESAREIARQIRLRDIGGLIIVDFIDLYDEKNRKKVYDELKKEMSRDRAKSVVLPMTQFGLVQMTRQRVRQQLVQTMSEPCPTCNGKGIVQSKSTIARRMERWLSHFRSQTREFRLTLTASPQLIEFLTEGDSMSRLTKMMLRHFVRIKVVPDEALGIEQFRFFSVKRQEDITEEYMPK